MSVKGDSNTVKFYSFKKVKYVSFEYNNLLAEYNIIKLGSITTFNT